jgi:short-subunit dehydrogenase
MSIYKDKKVLITGASTGIGYALAEELNKRGAEVILTARSEDKLHALAEKIKASGGKAHVFPEDLSIQGSAEALYNQIKTQNLSVDILINNAGYGRWGELTSFERDDYAEMLQLNVVTLTDLCHLYLPDMVQTRWWRHHKCWLYGFFSTNTICKYLFFFKSICFDVF